MNDFILTIPYKISHNIYVRIKSPNIFISVKMYILHSQEKVICSKFVYGVGLCEKPKTLFLCLLSFYNFTVLYVHTYSMYNFYTFHKI
jgi:hypothetical protein